jgi:hypothetical protein
MSCLPACTAFSSSLADRRACGGVHHLQLHGRVPPSLLLRVGDDREQLDNLMEHLRVYQYNLR